MRLSLFWLKIKDTRFGERTRIADWVLQINKQELEAILKEDKRLGRVDMEIAHPGERCRILQVIDVLQPRAKRNARAVDFPGALGRRGEVGEDRTVALKGVSVVISEYREAGDSSASLHGEMIDMWGPAAELSPYGQTHNLVLLPRPAEGIGQNEYRIALKLAGLKAGVYLARAGKAVTPDETEIFELPPVTQVAQGMEDLPKVVYIFQIMTTQFSPIPGYPFLYGLNAQGMLPTIVHPNVILDGALVTPYRSQAMDTYHIQNHAVIRELYHRHGTDLCFVGVILTMAHDNEPENERTALMAAQLAKSVLGADGVILTKSGGGAPEIPMAQTAQKCEALGIRSAVAMLHYAADASDSSFEGGIIFNIPEVNAIVSMGTPWDSLSLPSMDRLIGTPVPPSEEKRLTGEIKTKLRWIRGAKDQLGGSMLTAARY
jgi:sarcosine reductase